MAKMEDNYSVSLSAEDGYLHPALHSDRFKLLSKIFFFVLVVILLTLILSSFQAA